MTQIIIVTAAFDAADRKWAATSPDVVGLFLTADSWGDLIERLPSAIHDRLSRSTARHRGEFSIEVLLHTTLRVTMEAPAKYHVGVSAGPRRAACAGGHLSRSAACSIHSAA